MTSLHPFYYVCFLREGIKTCTSRHQSASEETEGNKKSIKIVMFDSQVFLANRSQGLERKKKEESRI